MNREIVNIMEDGKISDDEIPQLKAIVRQLDGIAETISELRLATDKILKGR